MDYLVYCRKSTEAEDRQVMSIDSQESELKRLAERDGLKIAKVYKESMSAKAPGRPVFESMLISLESSPASLLVWKPDRLARNAFDGGKISWLMDRGLIQEIRTPEKTFRKTSDDLFMLGLDFGIAKKYVDDLSVNVKRGIRAKLDHGIWHNTAPLGYQNNKADKTITLDTVAAPFIKTVFELYASGNYNLRELTKVMHEKGLRSKAGKKVDKTGIRRILMNPFYYGVMMSHGVSYQGKHESLVSKELFDKANDVLSGKHQSKRQKRYFPLRGFMTCAVCGCALTATLQKGKYVYYYCTNGKSICEERKKHLTADDAVSLIVPLFEKLQVDEKFLDIALTAEAKEDKTMVSSKESIRQSLQKKLDAVRKQQDTLVLRKDVPEDVFARNMVSLRNDQIDLEVQLSKIGKDAAKEEITFEQVKNVFLEANDAAKAFSKGDDAVQRHYVETILSNVFVSSQKVADCRYKNAYQRIADITNKGDLLELRGACNDVRTILSLKTPLCEHFKGSAV